MTVSMQTAKNGIIRWGPALLWMAIIYAFSSRPDLPHLGEPWAELAFRKTAHVIEYALLGGLVARGLGVNGWRGVLASLVLGGLYAASDEWHQTFVAGRNGNAWDVMLDTAAVALGAWSYRLLRVRSVRTNRRIHE